MFTDKKLVTLGATAMLATGGGTTAFSFRNIKAEDLQNMDAKQIGETLSNGVDELVSIITPLLNEGASYIGDLVQNLF